MIDPILGSGLLRSQSIITYILEGLTMNVQAILPDSISRNLAESLKRNKKSCTWIGVAMSLVGVLSILFPVVSSYSITLFIGAFLFASGVFTTMGAFSVAGTGPFFGFMLLGLLKLGAGLIVFFHPITGMLYLTTLVGIVFIFEGAFEMSFAFELRPLKGWGWQLFSAVLSILAGGIIISSLPTASLWLVGFIFGINILSSGLATIFIARNVDEIAKHIQA